MACSNFGVADINGFRLYVGPPAGFKSKVYSYEEAEGLAIFNADSYTQQTGLPAATGQINGGQCYLCHLTTNHSVEAYDPIDNPYNPINGPAPGIYNPIFTDFSYDNLGIPVNPRIAELAGPQDPDLGLGGQATLLGFACPTCDPADEEGKFKVSSLRNLSRTAPYGHNGFFATIYDIVHFYNTRDVVGAGWPASEVPETVNKDELGNLGLTLQQEQKLVLFLETLND